MAQIYGEERLKKCFLKNVNIISVRCYVISNKYLVQVYNIRASIHRSEVRKAKKPSKY